MNSAEKARMKKAMSYIEAEARKGRRCILKHVASDFGLSFNALYHFLRNHRPHLWKVWRAADVEPGPALDQPASPRETPRPSDTFKAAFIGSMVALQVRGHSRTHHAINEETMATFIEEAQGAWEVLLAALD